MYKYFQENTRYISVQLGIGGWKPFPASYVYAKGYGDCKALVNYLGALLKIAGVYSSPVVTKRKSNFTNIISDFPSNQFNHVILFVPLKEDSLWLECTSQSIPFGHIGADNEDRHTLLVDSVGGKLIKVPSSSSKENGQTRVSNVILKSDGSATARVKLLYSGDQQDWVRRSIINKSFAEKEKWLKKNIHAGSFQLVNLNIGEINNDQRSIPLEFHLDIPRIAPKSGKRLFFKPEYFIDPITNPQSDKERNHPIILNYPYLDIDSIIVQIPEDFSLESKPESYTIQTDFGQYSLKIFLPTADKILYIRKLELFRRKIESVYYSEYQEFYKRISKNDKIQLVFVKN